MKITNSEIVELYENFKDIGNRSLSVSTGFSLIKNKKIIEPIYQAIMETRNEILRENGDILEDGSVSIPHENRDKVNQQLGDLGLIQNECSLDLVPLSELKSYQFTLNEIEAMMPMIDGEA